MNDFALAHKTDKEAFVLHPHIEHQYQAVFVLRGTVSYQVEKKTYRLEPGSMVVLNTLEAHSLKVLSYPYERYVMQLAPAFFQDELRYPEIIAAFVSRPADFSHVCQLSGALWREVLGQLEQMEREYSRQALYWKMMIGCGLRHIFVSLFREHPSAFNLQKTDQHAGLAFMLQNYLDKHYVEALRVEDLAEHFYVNKYHMSHTFKKVTGYSIMQYIIFLRMNKAKVLLLEGRFNISEIALLCGYTDFSHFSKTFRKHELCSPKEFISKYTQRSLSHGT